jgi:hypothetical protein
VIARHGLGRGGITDAKLIREAREGTVRGEGAVVVGAGAADGVAGVIVDRELDAERQAGWKAVGVHVPLERGIWTRFPFAGVVPNGTARWRGRISRGGQGVSRREHEGCKPSRWVVGHSTTG